MLVTAIVRFEANAFSFFGSDQNAFSFFLIFWRRAEKRAFLCAQKVRIADTRLSRHNVRYHV